MTATTLKIKDMVTQIPLSEIKIGDYFTIVWWNGPISFCIGSCYFDIYQRLSKEKFINLGHASKVTDFTDKDFHRGYESHYYPLNVDNLMFLDSHRKLHGLLTGHIDEQSILEISYYE